MAENGFSDIDFLFIKIDGLILRMLNICAFVFEHIYALAMVSH